MSRRNRFIEDMFPLSPLQMGFLFHSLDPGQSEAYIQQASGALHGALDVVAWKRAWQAVVERHPMLRTAFHWEGRREPLQVVHQAVELPWDDQDWRGDEAALREERIQSYLRQEVARGFDLARPPLMRFGLLRLGDESHHFVWTFHHILVDGWSVAILLREVSAHYEAGRQGMTLDWPRPRPFRDYIKWLRAQDHAAAEEFWKGVLKGFSSPTSLLARGLCSRDRPSGHASCYLRLGERATTAIQEMGRLRDLTLSTLLEGAWALLLHRYSGEDDVVFGTTFAGRSAALPGVDSIVGPLINTLPIRTQIESRASSVRFLKSLQSMHLAVQEFEYSSLAEISRHADAPPGQPLFDNILVFQNYPMRNAWQENSRSIVFRDIKTVERAHYPLGLRINPAPELLLELIHDRACFSDDAARRALGHLGTILESFAADPERRISDIPLLTDAERRAMSGWGMSAAAHTEGRCVHELFEAQAGRTPEAIAVICRDERLTYGELDRRSNQLARWLLARGVGPEVRVGICVDPSPLLLIAILGVLKAGGAYVPLDPSYPLERLAFALSDSSVYVLLSEERRIDELPQELGLILCLDLEWPSVAGESDLPVWGRASADGLAYLLYTSGSTGRPKGVLIGHKGLTNLALTQIELLALSPRSRVLQFASISFDASTWEIFATLLCGGTLCIAPLELRLPGAELSRLLRELEITHATLAPSVLSALPDDPLPALEVLISAGEACSAELVGRFGAGRRFFNAYGPTEATVCATIAPCESDRSQPDIGRPIKGARVILLDAEQRMVPVNVPGEIFLGGAGLARGYHQNPALTAERFVPDPFSSEAGARLYRTGDRARYREDGTLEFLGRIDDQVKIRGVRVEPAEIAAVLALHPGVRESVVVLREISPGESRLVAYCVLEEGDELTRGDSETRAAALRAHLSRYLPAPMIPSLFVELERMPLTPSDKVDKRALPAPSAVAKDLIEPRSTLEKTLRDIWRQTLQIERVGIDDNFFELGGHSLLAIEIVMRAKQAGLSFDPGQILAHPTIAALAEVAEASAASSLEPCESGKRASPLLVLQPEGLRRPLFCVHTGTGSVLPYRHLVSHLGRERPIYGLQFADMYDERTELTSIEELAARYVELLLQMQPDGAYLIAGHSGGAIVAFEMCRQLFQRTREIALLAVLDNPAPAECLNEVESGGSVVVSNVNLLKRYLRVRPSSTDVDLEQLDCKEQLTLLLDHLKQGALAPQGAELDWVRGFVRLQEAFGRAIRSYAKELSEPKGATTPIPISLFRTREFAEIYGAASFGWARVSSREVRVHDIPGDHVSMLIEPEVSVLAQLLQTSLEEAESRT